MDKMVIEKLTAHKEWLKNEGNGKRADFRGVDLERANFAGADLSRANFAGAYLYKANFVGAYLYKANFVGADLERANLKEANLEYTSLCKANLIGANLSEANLSRANLERANFGSANLMGADLRGARYSIAVVMTSIKLGALSDKLTLELMRHDAELVEANAMNVWAEGGQCPFEYTVRGFWFEEDKKLWKPGKPKLRGLELWKAICKELEIKIGE